MDETTTAALPRPRRSILGRIGRGLAGLCLLLAVAIVGGYNWLVWRGMAFEPTGDALYDTWAEAVVDRQCWRLFTGGGAHPVHLPDAQLANWESQFGTDPRYWELRYWNALQTGGSGLRPLGTLTGSDLYDNQDEAQPLLDLARQHAPLDADIAWFAWQSRRRELLAAADDQADDLNGLSREQRRAEVRRRIRTSENEERRLLTQLAVAEPENAWGHYMLARHCFYLGEEVKGQAALDAGNDALVCRLPELFPVSFVRQRHQDDQRAGSAAVAGAVIEARMAEALPNYIKLRELSLEALVVVAMSGDTTQLDGVHDMFCRIGAADNAGLMEQSIALQALDEIAAEFRLEYEADLSQPALDSLGAVTTVGGRIGASMLEFARAESRDNPDLAGIYSYAMQGPLVQLPGGEELTEADLAGASNSRMTGLLLLPVLRYQLLEGFEARQLELAGELAGQLRGLRSLDYGELTGEPDDGEVADVLDA